MSESPFNKVAALKTGYFIKKKTPTKVFYCDYCKIFKNTYFEKKLETADSVHSIFKLQKWEMENSSKWWPGLWNSQKQPFGGAFVVHYFFKQYRCLKNVIHQIDRKNEWLLLLASFTANFGLFFFLNSGKRFFLEISIQKAISEANVKANRMVSTKWTYQKQRSFASN